MEVSKLMKVSEIKTAEPFKSLFRIDDRHLESMENTMKEYRYDESKPITIWKGRNIVIDGHIRLKAAQNIGRFGIPVFEREFKDEDEALEYAVRHQRNRRNLTDADYLHLVEIFDDIYHRGGDRRSKFGDQNIDNNDNNHILAKEVFENLRQESSRDVTAKKIGISADKVSQCRHVLQNCTNREIKEIRNGSKSLHQVYKASLAAKKKEEKKVKDEEIRWKRIQEMRSQDFPCSMSKKDLRHHDELAAKLDFLADKIFPKLEECAPDILDLLDIVEYFKSEGDETFKIFCERVPIRRFLGSLFVNDFIAVLRYLGIKILTPRSLNVIYEERVTPVKRRRSAPLPHCSAARFNEPGFVSKTDRREMGRRMAWAAECDMAEYNVSQSGEEGNCFG
jgi:hypothetical protein